MIRVLIADDSAVSRDLLSYILESDPGIKVVGTAVNGKEAVDLVKELQPDIITMDIEMPVMDGVEATRRIMASNPLPIIIVSSFWNTADVNLSFRALEIGAIAIADKPKGPGAPEFEAESKKLIKTVKLMSEIRVVKRIYKHKQESIKSVTGAAGKAMPPERSIKIAGIGASTGGPQVLEKILRGIRKDLSIPLLVVQHITPGFTQGFITWMNQSSGIPVKLAEHNEKLKGGVCYVAPDHKHMLLESGWRVYLSDGPPLNSHRPSVSALFGSLLKEAGAGAMAVLLSGMGKDGAQEMKKLRDAGATTVIQNQESCIIFGMPGEAKKLGGAEFELTPDRITDYLNQLN